MLGLRGLVAGGLVILALIASLVVVSLGASRRISSIKQDLGAATQASAQLRQTLADQAGELATARDLAAQAAADRVTAQQAADRLRQRYQSDRRAWQAKLTVADQRWMETPLPPAVAARLSHSSEAPAHATAH